MASKFRKTFSYNGKKYQVYASSEREAYEKMFRKKQELEEGDFSKTVPTVRKWTEIAIDTYKTAQKPITRTKFVSRVDHCILEHIGSLRLDKVTPLDCQRVVNLQQGKSKTQVNEVFNALKFIFSTACNNDIIRQDPTRRLIKPSYTSGRRRAITEEEREIIEKCFRLDPRFIAFAIMLYCGCRPSEARAVTLDDIFTEDNRIFLKVRGTKTASSARIVPVPPKLQDLLPNECQYTLSHTKNGRALNAGEFNLMWKKFKREMNILMGAKTYRNKLLQDLVADDLVPYCLRHTFCTDLQKAGVDLRTAQYLMGHADIKMTANIYTHVDTEIVKSTYDILSKK